MATVGEQVAVGLKWTAGAKFAGQLITWGITIVVMRLLVPEDYGLLAMASLFVAFLLMVAEIGLGPALVQSESLSSLQLRQALGVILALNIGLMLLLNLAALGILGYFEDSWLESIIRVLSLQFPLVALTTIPEVLLQRKLQFKQRSLIELGSALAGSLMTLVLAMFGHGVWSLVVGNLLSALVRLFAVNSVAPFFKRPAFDLGGTRVLLRFAGNVSMTRILWFFFTQIDVLIVGKLLGKEALGYYSVAMHLASLPVQRVSSVLGQVAFPVFSRYQSNPLAVIKVSLTATSVLCLLGFPVLWGLSSVSSELVLVLIGRAWQTSVVPLQLIALVMPFRIIANFLPNIIDSMGRPEVNTKNVLLASIVMPVAFLVGSRWGLIGVAYCWVVVYPFVLTVNGMRSISVIGIKAREFGLVILPSLISAIGMYLSVIAIRSVLPESLSLNLRLLTLILTGIVSYVLLSLVINREGVTTAWTLLRRQEMAVNGR